MIQFMKGTQSQLQSLQAVLPAGQPVFEQDTGQLKIGNGSSFHLIKRVQENIFHTHKNRYSSLM